jgi:hypothetical protein
MFEVTHCYCCLVALKKLNHGGLLLLNNAETAKP